MAGTWSGSRMPGFVLAAVLDAAFGDPPNAAHPVAWFGRLAARVEASTNRVRAGRARAGAVSAVALVSTAAATAEAVGRPVPHASRWMVDGLLLALACSRRDLLRRGDEVAGALERRDLDEARRLLAFHLVSRDTSSLDPAEIAGAAIESVAENLSDGVVAPWCWYALAGTPGAWGYRALNTLDAMWGYRTPRYEQFGRAAARADDVANFVPARLTALAIVAAAGPAGASTAGAWRAWRRDARATSSPNAGHPMAAMAGALGVTLTKRGEYVLHAPGRAPDAADLRAAVRVASLASWLAAAALVVAMSCAAPLRSAVKARGGRR